MSNKIHNRLDAQQTYSLNVWVHKKHKTFNGLTIDDVAKLATRELGFEVTEPNIKTSRKATGVSWQVPRITRRQRIDLTTIRLLKIVRDAITFDAPLVQLGEQLHILELFHGPTLAFKDFGARFMARLMGWLTRDDDRELTVLVATSGDTGGAVASAFHNVPGTRVVILYPQGKVSGLQEKQLTTDYHGTLV